MRVTVVAHPLDDTDILEDQGRQLGPFEERIQRDERKTTGIDQAVSRFEWPKGGKIA